MILVSLSFRTLLLCVFCSLWVLGGGTQMIGGWNSIQHERRQNSNDNGNGQGNVEDNSAFSIVNGRIFTPGLGIVLAPQPFTPMGGDFLHIALDVSGDGKLPVPPRSISDPLTQVFNFTLFLTSIPQQKNFTISNMTATTPPLADILAQEPGQTVKHINFEWPDCLVGTGTDVQGTARGEYNISIHQNYRLNGVARYTIFNLPIAVTNTIPQFPGAGQLSTNPLPGPLSATGGRVSCARLSNPVLGFAQLVASVNNPPGQPLRDIAIQTTPRSDGGQVGAPGEAGANQGNNGQGQIVPGQGQAALGAAVRMTGEAFSFGMLVMMGAVVIFSTSAIW
ncbi:hypothetical protein ACN47E_004607 [Coniothyrium glycines]